MAYTLYKYSRRGPLRIPGYHDPDQTRIIDLIFRPAAWADNTVYYKPNSDSYDTVLPTVFQGLYFKVKHPGKSGATDPFTGTYIEGDEVEDGSVVWEAVNYNLLPLTETISSVPAPTATHGITIAVYSNTTTTCQFTIPPITAAAEAAGYFEVSILAVQSNGETIPVTLHFAVAEL